MNYAYEFSGPGMSIWHYVMGSYWFIGIWLALTLLVLGVCLYLVNRKPTLTDREVDREIIRAQADLAELLRERASRYPTTQPTFRELSRKAEQYDHG